MCLSLQTTKKGGKSIKDDILNMKSLANSLMPAGQKISDDELTLYILGGLGPKFEVVVVHLTSLESVTLQEVQHVLQKHEMHIESLNSSTMIKLSPSTTKLLRNFPLKPLFLVVVNLLPKDDSTEAQEVALIIVEVVVIILTTI